MKTKYIFNLLALAMLMPAMLLTTACSNEDDVVNNTENIANKGYELPVTVNVTRQDAAATRASFDGSKLNFGEGDKLFVKGNDYSEGGAGFFAGTLTWQSGGTFSGTILTENHPYSGTIDDLFKAENNPLATLIPANYVKYSYLSFTSEGTCSASVNYNTTKTFATSKATAVEQFSFEVGGYTSGTGFALHPANAILNFTITGLAANTGVDVALSHGVSFTISGSVTTDDLGTATFAIAVYGSTDLNEFSLTVAGNAITLVSSEKTLTAGKIYNITRSAAPAAATGHALSASVVGEVVGTNGLAYAVADKDNLPTGVTAAGMVAYKSGSNGLVIALADEASTMNWSTANGASGAAAHTPTVTGQTWKLPSQAEWQQMFSANGGNQDSYTDLNTALAAAGGDSSKLQEGAIYWSSSESSPCFDAYYVGLGSGLAGWGNGSEDHDVQVRACLAF